MNKIIDIKEERIPFERKLKGPDGKERVSKGFTTNKIITITGAKQELILKSGETKTLSNGLKVQFNGHSHKMVHPGQRSPLILNFEFEYDGKAETTSIQVYKDIKSSLHWYWNGFVFVHIDSEYNQSVKFEVTDQRDLEVEKLL